MTDETLTVECGAGVGAECREAPQSTPAQEAELDERDRAEAWARSIVASGGDLTNRDGAALLATIASLRAERDALAERILRAETRPPFPETGHGGALVPLDEPRMRALRDRWAFGPEQYQADADALIVTTLHAQASLAAAVRERNEARATADQNAELALSRCDCGLANDRINAALAAKAAAEEELRRFKEGAAAHLHLRMGAALGDDVERSALLDRAQKAEERAKAAEADRTAAIRSERECRDLLAWIDQQATGTNSARSAFAQVHEALGREVERRQDAQAALALVEERAARAEAPAGCSQHFPGQHEVLSSLRRLRALPVIETCMEACAHHDDRDPHVDRCGHPRLPPDVDSRLDRAPLKACPLRPENRR